ncbi:phosphate ABC transporter substrate-binding protein PstS [Thiobacillus sp.]|jgi:phosphate transport system substrate-binding protein|uniref:phosphate ABC transporter substrate-binding protein PstS n=1 Tax=Thiobacillus sp. TaxID=924 RepID=UPI0011D734C3|nr:phosphate ABC transporter substrate-binding protein PstS [Thiobacillus sp.]MBD3811144.1 phosphate ABC transporter substrate-binding protein PstS [Betaproteobacteria bacterium]MBC2730962.1 phosphate ABC transporter substrate-binding protein PstS [Thiobacillus sp.]MBC2739699.1 phosphate ABC transporter substrate-binding protein PstS [Thiobacillus sp.]MBC2758694.1 phosphate ABC transporter substrate-binding protein PstS [Thiobacillus sp.]TXH73909.1 MAG: phosphate ABC transporter substrate-bind
MRTLNKLAQGTLAAAMGLAFSVGALAADITGAGATFPYAVYTKWAEAYKTATGNQVNYQGIGSSGGVKQIKAKTVDFAGSDAPVPVADLEANHLVQVPTVMGGVTIVMNVPGFESGKLKLDGVTAADIFRGAITKWNDPAIAKLNPGVKLPDLAITVAHRSDGSGTTYAFSNYLAKQSMAFKRDVGAGNTVNWPANGVGGKGNPGVAANVQKIKGAIGYVDIADAMKNNMNFVALKNRAGNFIVPNQQSVADAAAGADFHVKGMAPDLLDQSAKNAWPITTATFMLAYEQGDAAKQKGVVDFYTWSLNNGQKMAAELGFVPLPPNVVKMVEAEMKNIK